MNCLFLPPFFIIVNFILLMQGDKDIPQRLHILHKFSWPAVFAGLLGIFIFLFFNQSDAPNPDLNTSPNMAKPTGPEKGLPADSTTAAGKAADSI